MTGRSVGTVAPDLSAEAETRVLEQRPSRRN